MVSNTLESRSCNPFKFLQAMHKRQRTNENDIRSLLETTMSAFVRRSNTMRKWQGSHRIDDWLRGLHGGDSPCPRQQVGVYVISLDEWLGSPTCACHPYTWVDRPAQTVPCAAGLVNGFAIASDSFLKTNTELRRRDTIPGRRHFLSGAANTKSHSLTCMLDGPSTVAFAAWNARSTTTLSQATAS
jgi:hypothetical protein